MPDKITFFAIVGGRNTLENPRGLARRLEFDGDGFTDEALRGDFSWKFTPVIIEWERGDFDDDLIEVSHEEASKIIEYFRERWSSLGRSLDP
jgi:hypothetical protein